MKQRALKSQDVAIAVKLALDHEHRKTYARLAEELVLTGSQVFEGVKRCEFAGLIARQDDFFIARSRELADFLLFGVRFVFPVALGEISKGMPTAWGGPYLKNELVASAEGPPVWPFSTGEARGPAVTPLYPTLPKAAQLDARFYNAMTLVDAVRMGRSRERELAIEQLRKMLK